MCAQKPAPLTTGCACVREDERVVVFVRYEHFLRPLYEESKRADSVRKAQKSLQLCARYVRSVGERVCPRFVVEDVVSPSDDEVSRVGRYVGR